MKIIHIISGVMLFLLIAVGSASAEILTDENSNLEVKQGLELPDGLISVTVTYNPSAGTIDFVDNSPTVNNHVSGKPYLENPRIDMIAYNLAYDAKLPLTTDIPTVWALPTNGKYQMDGFGTFTREYDQSDRDNRVDSVHVQLVDSNGNPATNTGDLSKNDNQCEVALHLAFEKAYNGDGQVLNSKGLPLTGANLGSVYIAGDATKIPEFPTIALPVAAILGLMFIIQRRKEN